MLFMLDKSARNTIIVVHSNWFSIAEKSTPCELIGKRIHVFFQESCAWNIATFLTENSHIQIFMHSRKTFIILKCRTTRYLLRQSKQFVQWRPSKYNFLFAWIHIWIWISTIMDFVRFAIWFESDATAHFLKLKMFHKIS